MAVTQTHVNNQIIKWRKTIFREWRRGNFFSAYMGESPTSIIQVSNELKDGGDIINITLVGALRGPGVSTGPLTGNEEKLDNYGMRLWIDWSRNAVLLTRAQMRKSAFEQLEVVRPLLTEWQNALLRDEIVQAMFAIPSEGPPVNLGNEATGGQRINGVLYPDASAQQLNDWNTANQDRILYGSAKTNLVVGNHASSLATIDAPTDKATAAGLLLAKRMARAANPGITPYRDSEDQGREWFVAFCGAETFRDLAADPTIVEANLHARRRDSGNPLESNPLFADGDLQYRGVIIREVPEISDFCTIAGATPIQPIFFCGQNAIALAWGQMPKPTERKEDDYGFLVGRGVESVYGVGKVFKKRDPESATTRLVQWGMLTWFVAATADV